MSQQRFLTITKSINITLLIILVVALSACSSTGKKKSKEVLGKTAVITSADGKVERLNSEDRKINRSAPKIPNVRFSKNNRICNPSSKSENLILKGEEIDFELSFMIDSLNNQRPSVKPDGKKYRRLSRNMLTNLYNTPDCKQYRFKLHIISKLLDGSSLDSMEN